MLVGLGAPAYSQEFPVVAVQVNGIELHYIETGAGEPLILLHGGQGDYRSWAAQIAVLSDRYRVISYSRRYNFPNQNPLTGHNHSAQVEAEDLAAFVDKLHLRNVSLVGTSIGAATALTYALRYPKNVRSMVLAEPPLHRLVSGTPRGAPLFRQFMRDIQDAARRRFDAGDDIGAMRIFVDGFAGTGRFDGLSADVRLGVMQNAGFFKAIAASNDPYPEVSPKSLGQLHIPTLIITGERTIELHKLVDQELARLLPNVQEATIPGAGHGSPRENPQAFNEALLAFLSSGGHR